MTTEKLGLNSHEDCELLDKFIKEHYSHHEELISKLDDGEMSYQKVYSILADEFYDDFEERFLEFKKFMIK